MNQKQTNDNSETISRRPTGRPSSTGRRPPPCSTTTPAANYGDLKAKKNKKDKKKTITIFGVDGNHQSFDECPFYFPSRLNNDNKNKAVAKNVVLGQQKHSSASAQSAVMGGDVIYANNGVLWEGEEEVAALADEEAAAAATEAFRVRESIPIKKYLENIFKKILEYF
jgi:hypothetical protein